ncbi:putative Transmembrane emp24 domain-containing protein 10 precursor [Tripterygium wilfordii]|uniref:Putative Transmembrane emp24 domain-containing protein 10 n=1 Tax=Tripterygium wilfordii TaxID=458696 RepID=A0A7J7DKK5_TRIWF|nr:transmembrane emp24 domain-containing protein p24delta5-like [Tripterygium wilfordii]KAF5746838.1 putative Transmembrane emp24 domain-containing protein 10 precursor [Tripterygium wilfordii]
MAVNFILLARVVVLTLILIVLTGNQNQVPVAEAVWLTIPASEAKCVMEDIQNNVVVLADYYVINETAPHETPGITVRVTSPFGNNLHHKENVTFGQFAFTTTEPGNYLACFSMDGNQGDGSLTMSLDWKIGIAAKDWESVARKDKIEGVELHLTRLEAIAQAIHVNTQSLMKREWEMREVSEKTNARVVWFSTMSLGVCILVSILQVWHLKRYFQKKKLI